MAPITLITAPPVFMPLEQFAEFQASTPASGTFNHEPVLHHLEKNALVTVEPAVEGFDHSKNPRGDVYVTEAALAFFNPETKTGFSVPYPTITLHATSRQPRPSPIAEIGTSSSEATTTTAEAEACVYCQLDETEPQQWDDMAEEDQPETREMYIFPTVPSAVEEIYAALSRCAALHPSTDDENTAPALDLGSLVTGNEDGSEEGDGHTVPSVIGSTNGESGTAGRTQRSRLEDLIDWNGFEPREPVNGSTIVEEERMQDAVEDQ